MDIIQIDTDRFVCGGGRCLVVCELPSGRVIHDQTNVPGIVNGVCVFEECSSGPGVLPDAEALPNPSLPSVELPPGVSSSHIPSPGPVLDLTRGSGASGGFFIQPTIDDGPCVGGAATDTGPGELQHQPDPPDQHGTDEGAEEEITGDDGDDKKDAENEKLKRIVEEKVRENEELRQVLQEKVRENEELGQVLQEKVREIEELGQTLQEKIEALQRKEAENLEIRSSKEILRDQLHADGLSTRTREFCRRLDAQRVSTLDLLERYRLRGCIDFREHILSSSDFDLARESSDGRFAFRDLWFGHGQDELSLVPFEEEEGAGEVLLSAVETIVLNLFNDSSLAEIVFDESHVSRDDMLDLQEDWDGFFRSEPVYDTAKLMEVCEDSTRRKVSFVVSRIFDFFGGKVTDELRGRYEAYCGSRVASECLLGSLKGFGLGRHRSMCFKVACDRLGIPCRLIRGWRTCSVDGLTEFEQKRADAWCVVNLRDRLHFVDLVDSGSLLSEFHPVLCEPGRRSADELEGPPSIDLVRFGSEYPNLSKDSLGHGGFGQAFAVEFGGEFLAVKETNLTQRIAEEGPAATARVRRELNLMSSFHHPNIVPTIGSFEFVRRSRVLSRRRRRTTQSSASRGGETIIGIVMPLYDQNAKVLREILREADSLVALRETLFLLLSVANGLRYLHSLSILHLDMKPDNVLVNVIEEEFTLSEIRICDFGGSRPHCTLMSLSALPVSLGFCSPEVKQAAEGDKTIVLDESADVYSFGALMRFYRCYFGTFRELYELCDRCLSVDCLLRPNLIEVMSILRSHLLFVDGKCGRADDD